MTQCGMARILLLQGYANPVRGALACFLLMQGHAGALPYSTHVQGRDILSMHIACQSL